MNKYIIKEQIDNLLKNDYFCYNINLDDVVTFFINIKCRCANKIKINSIVKIEVPIDYPNHIPIVYDYSNTIPRKDVFHCYKNGILCLEHPVNIYSKFQCNKTLLYFVEKFVIPFYYNYHYKVKYGKYPYGDYSHHTMGTIEAIMEYFSIKEILDPKELILLIEKDIMMFRIFPKDELDKLFESLKLKPLLKNNTFMKLFNIKFIKPIILSDKISIRENNN